MVKNLLRNGQALLFQRQTSILSAATVIMITVAASRLLGLVRNRILAHFFLAETLSVYFAAFRLPDVIIEVLVFGALSSAFIPVFSSYLAREKRREAWYVAGASLNLALLIFTLFALVIFLFAQPIYGLIAPGFTSAQIDEIAALTRTLLLAQSFFVASYLLTGVLESQQRFLVPALAPIFYNLGIIFGTVFLAGSFGIWGPVFGAVFGAFLHFGIQLPLAVILGFRPSLKFDLGHPGVREIGRLAAPRIVELSFLQVSKSVELFLASLISAAAYTHFIFASSLELIPVGFFGISIAKASLPTLAAHAARKGLPEFKKIFLSSFNEILFLTVPTAVALAVLRIPVVRLAFGAARFSWESTVQTGYALSAFSLGIFAHAAIYLLARAFYALKDTVTPVKISISAIGINIVLSLIFVRGLGLPIWALGLAFALASIYQAASLMIFLDRKVNRFDRARLLSPFLKIAAAASFSGGAMFVLLKILDRSAWDKKLSFLGKLGLGLPTTFENFVLDTRYTGNLLILTLFVALVGAAVYLFACWILKVEELSVFVRLIHRLKGLRQIFEAVPPEKKEAITVLGPDEDIPG